MKLLRSFGLIALLCGSSIAFAQPAPCTLLSQGQVSAVIEANVAGSPISTTGCSWKGPKVVVTISMASDKIFTGAKRGSKGAASGVADDAFFTGTDGFVTLWVKKGNTTFFVRAYGLPLADAQPKLTGLAKSAASKL